MVAVRDISVDRRQSERIIVDNDPGVVDRGSQCNVLTFDGELHGVGLAGNDFFFKIIL